MSSSTASIKPTPVVASSAVELVNAWATIAPDRSTPRWSFFQPRWPRPPYFAAAHSPSPTIDSPVLSTKRWTGPLAGMRWSSTSSRWLRRESVVWSGASRPARMRARTDRKKPSVWRKGNLKISRSDNAVSIARSENRLCPPGRPDGDGVHASVASAESHSVTSPRSTSARSYSRQFPTRYFVLYLGCTLDFMVRSCAGDRQHDQRVDDCLRERRGTAVHQRPPECSGFELGARRNRLAEIELFVGHLRRGGPRSTRRGWSSPWRWQDRADRPSMVDQSVPKRPVSRFDEHP